MIEILNKKDLSYFKRGERENPEFFNRFEGEPSFKNLEILDLGCGQGSLCVYIAKKGVKKILGIDINPKRIDFANENIEKNYHNLKDKIEFKCVELSDLDENLKFDIIISKDSFEHIANINQTLNEIKKRLKANGKAYIGFSPLYYAFNGDHGYYWIKFSDKRKICIPWKHLIQERIFGEQKIADLNKLSFKDYEKSLNESGMEIIYFKVNQSTNSTILKLFSLIRRVKILENYFTYNLYCILKN